MLHTPDIVQRRLHRRRAARRSPAGRAGLGCSTLLSLLAVAVIAAATLVYADLTGDLPSLATLPLLLDPLNGLLLQPTRLYDHTGEQVILTLENPASAGRNYLPLDDSQPEHLPTALVSATVAAADPTFWTNPGYSLDGWRQGGHPTLAQRLVSDLILWDEPPGLRRNLRERLLAAQLTARFDREQVMEWYLNSASYGRLIYGADAAARVYLGKPATGLSLAEAALLAAVAEAPAFNPLDAPQLAVERQQQLIQDMLIQGLITSDEAYRAAAEPLAFAPPVEAASPAPAFTQLALEQLATVVPLGRLERGGFRAITTLDYDLQLQANCAAQSQLALLAGSQGGALAFDGAPCQAARLLPTLPIGDDHSFQGLATSAIVLDPHTGQVSALVGEPSPGLDPAHTPGHSSGTLLTPFVYLTAFARGLSPASLAWDVPASPPEGGDTEHRGEVTQPAAQSPDGKLHGPVRLRIALANDYFVPAAQTLAQVGADSVWRTAAQFGLAGLSGTRPVGDLFTLEETRVTLLEASQAFGVFAAQGVLAGQRLDPAEANLSPSAVLRLEDATGKVWADWTAAESKAVVSPQLAYLMTHVLSDETARWPSLGHPNPLEIGRPAAAKIGRTSQGEDAWAVGYTPQMVVGVWAGYAEGVEGGEVPPNVAAALWHAVIQYAHRDRPSQGWAIPPGIVTVDVCDPSGLLPTVYCPTVVSEIFLSGSEPTHTDTLYRAFQVNRETGRLATVFTPPELVEERVYLVVPSQHAAWAQQAGLPIPPDTYDAIYAPPPPSPEARITSPAMFGHVRGQVALVGSAKGEGFAYYRLQVGQGLNPQQWVQIGQDATRPVEEGVLGVWDTAGLSGLYAVQLLVVREDQRVETGLIQVTVDNTPPEALILNPVEGQSFSSVREKTVVFQASASDDVALASVSFYVDGRLEASLTQSPWMISWQARAGSHTLRVVASDLAGNTSETSVKFTVK